MAFPVKLLALLLVPVISFGIVSKANAEPIVPLSVDCLQQVSATYGVHLDVLLAILIVEGGTVGQNNRGNTDLSYDIGPFQINSIHLPELRRMGITEEQLRNNGCVNASVAAWHLRRVVAPVAGGVITQDDYLRALARYHSATPVHNERYAGLLRNAFGRLYAQGGK